MSSATGIFRDRQQLNLINSSPQVNNYSVKWVFGGMWLQSIRGRGSTLPSHISNFGNTTFGSKHGDDPFKRDAELRGVEGYSTGAPRQEYYIFENKPENINAICVGLPSGANIVPVTTINLDPPVSRTVQGTISIGISKNQMSSITITCP